MQTVLRSMTGGVEHIPPRLNLPVVAAPPLIPWMKLRRWARKPFSLLRQRVAAIWLKAAVIAVAVMLTPATLLAGLGTSAITMGSAAGSSPAVVTTWGAWTATANDSFPHVLPGAGGTGVNPLDGASNRLLVVFTIDAFTGTRTGTVTFDIE